MTKLAHPQILVIGTGDTKADELRFIGDCIAAAGGEAIMMDVSVLGDPPYAPHHDKHAVAQAAETTIEAIAESGDENSAMSLMALGAKRLARRLHESGDIDGDARHRRLDGHGPRARRCAGVAARRAEIRDLDHRLFAPGAAGAHRADLMMILWAGGLYGLNGICKSVLSQACGAVVGAAR